ncbi:MAG TPA: hypothetical protein VGD81_19210 [Opitutaceae bacterium]
MARIAVIGTSLAGLACAHFLHRAHALTVFPQDGYTGGGPDAEPGDEPGLTFERATSPHLARLLDRLQVPLGAIPASFSIRDDTNGLEWRSHAALGHLFAQRRNLVNARFVRLLRVVRRFHREAPGLLDEPETAGQTLGDYVRRHGYGDDFFHTYLLPLSCALWTTTPEFMLSFPVAPLLRFFREHGLLQLRTTRSWSAVTGGATAYRERLTAPWRDRLRPAEQATRVVRTPHGATVMTDRGVAQSFEHVILATRADHALRLLVNPTPDETRLLGEFEYQRVTLTRHTDSSVMPRTRRAWAPWNCQLHRDAEGRLACATHRWLNPASPGADGTPAFVSINASTPIAPASVIRSTTREQPVFTLGTARAQTELFELNTRARGRTETYFCGHYFGCNSPEDELRSAVQLAALLLDRDPWG